MTIGQKYGLDYNTIVELYWLEDPPWSAIDIAKYYGCDYSIIYRFMHKYQIPVRSLSKALSARWRCPPKGKKLMEYNEEMRLIQLEMLKTNKEYRKKKAETTSKLWEDQEYREKHERAWKDPEYIKRKREVMKKVNDKRWHNP